MKRVCLCVATTTKYGKCKGCLTNFYILLILNLVCEWLSHFNTEETLKTAYYQSSGSCKNLKFDWLKTYSAEVYLESSRKSTMKLFCENSQRPKVFSQNRSTMYDLAPTTLPRRELDITLQK